MATPPDSCGPITTHVCIKSGPVCVGIGVGGRARCKETDSSLFEAGSPARSQQALWPAPTPPSWPQPGFLKLVASQRQLGGEETAETGFPGLTEQWPRGLPLTHIPHWLLSKEVSSPVTSRWACGSLCANTYTFSHSHT